MNNLFNQESPLSIAEIKLLQKVACNMREQMRWLKQHNTDLKKQNDYLNREIVEAYHRGKNDTRRISTTG